jgi:hypothetical protein
MVLCPPLEAFPFPLDTFFLSSTGVFESYSIATIEQFGER